MVKNVFWKFFKKQIKASSVLEVIIALTICMIIFSIAMRTILNLQSSNNIITEQKAEILVNMVKNENLNYLRNGNLIFQSDSITNELYPELNMVTLTVKHVNGRIIRQIRYYKRKYDSQVDM